MKWEDLEIAPVVNTVMPQRAVEKHRLFRIRQSVSESKYSPPIAFMVYQIQSPSADAETEINLEQKRPGDLAWFEDVMSKF